MELRTGRNERAEVKWKRRRERRKRRAEKSDDDEVLSYLCENETQGESICLCVR
jgi:hypothetical protein